MISPTNSWPMTMGTGIVFAAHASNCRCGDRFRRCRLVNRMSNVVDPDGRLGHVFEPESRSARRFTKASSCIPRCSLRSGRRVGDSSKTRIVLGRARDVREQDTGLPGERIASRQNARPAVNPIQPGGIRSVSLSRDAGWHGEDELAPAPIEAQRWSMTQLSNLPPRRIGQVEFVRTSVAIDNPSTSRAYRSACRLESWVIDHPLCFKSGRAPSSSSPCQPASLDRLTDLMPPRLDRIHSGTRILPRSDSFAR